jgi:transposase
MDKFYTAAPSVTDRETYKDGVERRNITKETEIGRKGMREYV